MDICVVEGKKPRTYKEKQLLRCHRYHKLGHFAYECIIPLLQPRGTDRSHRPLARKPEEEEGPTLLQSLKS